MRNHQDLKVFSLIGAILIFTIFLSSCATATPVIPDELPVPEEQSQVGVPGGLMILPDGSGAEHPVLVFDFQIQSRLVTHEEYQECVAAGACEPAAEVLHAYAPAGVSWYQAQSYCSYLGGRLPTEAELTRATGGSEDCPETGGSLVGQEGFGEWVYDWDDPNYYNGSLVSNPFGPLYGDLKVAMGLDLISIGDVVGKFWGKDIDDNTFAKYDEDQGSFAKYDEDDSSFAKFDDASFAKIEELKFFYKDELKLSVKLENGKWFIEADGADQDKWLSDSNYFPRLGMLPDQFNPLVGFRCITEGAPLSYAPICKTETAPLCSLPAQELETISTQLTLDNDLDPNFNIVGANCPQGNTYALTISHELPSGEGVEVKAGSKDCDCQEYADYPGKLYCSCPSPGAGLMTEVEICKSGQETLIPIDNFCQPGSKFDLRSGACSSVESGTPLIFSLVEEAAAGAGGSTCPSGPGLPVPNYGTLGLAAATVEGIGEGDLPEGDQWELFSLSDGSGMCPPGYGYSAETSCCTPLVETNYDCGPNRYFDAGTKQCLPVGWDGCGPCQELNDKGLCISRDSTNMIGGRCNVGNEEDNPVSRDDYGRPLESSEGCQEGAYLDPGLGRCIETRDGCALGYYLDPKTKTCRPISGPESPCGEGYIFSSTTGCCAPGPGAEGVEYPIGAANIDAAFPGMIPFAEDGCPTTNYYDPESDSCLLLVSGDCPPGTGSNLFGLCIPDLPGDCPDGTEFEPRSGSCPTSPPDPATCAGDKVFDAATGYCVPESALSGQRARADANLGDVSTVDPIGDAPELAGSCADAASCLTPLYSPLESPEGLLQCLIFGSDKTLLRGRGFCQPAASGDSDTESFFTVEFEQGKIASITRTSPDTVEPAEASEPPVEANPICFADYVFGPPADSGDGEDDWSEPVSGKLPDGAKCQLGLYLDAGSLFGPQACTTLGLTVPVCAAAPSSGGGSNKCTGLDMNSCGTVAGCGWNFGANQCDKCSALTKDDCTNAAGCTYDGVTCKPN